MKKIFTLIAAAMMAVCANAATEVDYEWNMATVTACPGWNGSPAGPVFTWGTEDGLKVENETAVDPWYNLQYHVASPVSLVEGQDYTATFTLKCEGAEACNLRYKFGNWSAGADGQIKVEPGVGFKEYTVKFTAAAGTAFLLLQHGDFVGTLWVKNIKVTHETGVETQDVEVQKVTYTDGPFPFYAMGCEPPVVDGSLHFEGTGEWSQFFIAPGVQLEAGDYRAVIRIKGTTAAACSLTAQNGWGGDAQQLTGSLNVPTEFTDVKVSFKEIVGGTYDFILKPGTYNGTIDVNSVTIYKIETITPSAIKNINVATGNNMMYNLAGQRVNNTKGIVIMNGKKVRF